VRLWIVDVFAEEKWVGNQLAVVADIEGLDTATMQRVAREMNYSETTFIESDRARDAAWPVRIFTPTAELPFAGHPTLGTAVVIRQELCGKPEPEAELVLALGVGNVPVRFEADEGPGTLAWMEPPTPELGPSFPRDLGARLLGLDAGDIDPDHPVERASVGISFLMVPVRSLDAVRRARYRAELLPELRERGAPSAVFVFAPETCSPENQIHARMFGPEEGVAEDPATGSANTCLGAWLLEHAWLGPGEVNVRVEQGYEIGRPSLLRVSARHEVGRVRVSVGGRVIFSARGELL
jgi:trans-2,3-dihydro-3-hydroxyanthranilate isomerase